jgi:hypothetical protein
LFGLFGIGAFVRHLFCGAVLPRLLFAIVVLSRVPGIGQQSRLVLWKCQQDFASIPITSSIYFFSASKDPKKMDTRSEI